MESLRSSIILLGLVGCTVSKGVMPLEGGGTSEDTGWTTSIDQIEVPPPTLLPEEVAEEISSFLAIGLPQAAQQKESLFELLSEGDDQCPGLGDNESWQMNGSALPGCTAGSGYWYHGPAGYTDHTATAPGDGIGNIGSRQIYIVAEGEIQDTGSHSMGFGGQMDAVWAIGLDDSVEFNTHFAGTWIWELGEAWQAAGASGRFDITGAKSAPTEEGLSEHSLGIDGAVALGTQAMFFDQVSFDPSCGPYPSGALEVRDPSGYWWRIDLPETCDTACGPLTFGADLVLDEACIDTDSLLADLMAVAQW